MAGTALVSVASGYLFANYEFRRSREASASGFDNQPYGTVKDFRDAIGELKAMFPRPGAVSDDPGVLAPYGFSENDYHPGKPAPCPSMTRA